MQNLIEGLMQGDLANLVLPVLSIDEYESKIIDDGIVVAFYVSDKDPASDLNRFLQKSPINLLDTDVSPAPNEEGNYLVFAEFERSDIFKQNLMAILQEIDSLVEIEVDEWSFTSYGHEGVYELNDKNLDVLVRIESIEELKQKAFKETVNNFFLNSKLNSILFEETNVVMTTKNYEITSQISFDVNQIMNESAVLFNPEQTQIARLLERILGFDYYVAVLENKKLVVENPDNQQLVLENFNIEKRI